MSLETGAMLGLLINFLSRNLRPCRRKVTTPAAMPVTGRQSAATLSSLTDNHSYQYLFFSHERLFDAAKLEYNSDTKVQSELYLYLFEISYSEYNFYKHLQLLMLQSKDTERQTGKTHKSYCAFAVENLPGQSDNLL